MTFEPYANQWDFLETVIRHSESVLDDIIEMNDLSGEPEGMPQANTPPNEGLNSYSLPPCVRTILQDGVTQNQRCVCFRLAVHFKRLGIPLDGAVALLNTWAPKNKPIDNKGIITKEEIIEQASCAYRGNYRSYGCDTEAIKPFCHPECPVYRQGSQNKPHAGKRKRNIGDETTGS